MAAAGRASGSLRPIPLHRPDTEQALPAGKTVLCEAGLTDWAAPGGSRDLRGYSFFAGPVEES